MSSENGPQISENFLDAARADADAKYEVYRKAYSKAKYDAYREAYSDWWRAVVVLGHLTEEENAVA